MSNREPENPIDYAQLYPRETRTREEIEDACRQFVDRALSKGLGVSSARYEGADGQFLRLSLPAGREEYGTNVIRFSELLNLLEQEFEAYSFVGNYRALCRYDNGEIEAVVSRQAPDIFPSTGRFLSRRLFAVEHVGEPTDAELVIKVTSERGVEIELSPASSMVNALLGHWRLRDRSWSLKMRGLRFDRNEQAVRLLETLSDSFLFQLDLLRDVPLGLVRRTSRTPVPPAPTDETLQPEFPRQEFDHPPMILYRYGRHARGMPLIEYLGYYQCIEYYFPWYYSSELKEQIKGILKDPRFRSDRDADIGRIIEAAKGVSTARERDLLRLTLRACVTVADLSSWFDRYSEAVNFFKKSDLTEKTVNIRNQTTDLRDQVSDRVYDIRCKIVHIKGETVNFELLLPNSPQADQLDHDIELARFLAQRVLIQSASALDGGI